MVPHEDNISVTHEGRVAMRLLLESVRRQGGKQCTSQSKLAAEDSSRQASQSG